MGLKPNGASESQGPLNGWTVGDGTGRTGGGGHTHTHIHTESWTVEREVRCLSGGRRSSWRLRDAVHQPKGRSVPDRPFSESNVKKRSGRRKATMSREVSVLAITSRTVCLLREAPWLLNYVNQDKCSVVLTSSFVQRVNYQVC